MRHQGLAFYGLAPAGRPDAFLDATGPPRAAQRPSWPHRGRFSPTDYRSTDAVLRAALVALGAQGPLLAAIACRPRPWRRGQ